jgi:hypothetical protein
MGINVIIPSYKRSHDLKGKDYFFMAVYCVPESQYDDYLKVLPKERIITLPDNEDGDIVKKRNWILKNIARPLIMIDDDVSKLVFWDNRKENYLSKEYPKDLLSELFNEFVSLGMQFNVKLFGVAQNKDDRQFKEFIPFNLSNIILGPFQGHLDHDLKFDNKVGSKDDYDMALQQLQKYKKVLRFNKFAYECEHGDNKGGIVSYRSKEKEIEYCKAIMIKWGKKIIQYRIPPLKITDLLNAKKVNIPIKGV